MNDTPKLTPEQKARAVWSIEIRPLYNLTEMARRLGISKGTIHNWVRVPEAHVEKMSEMTNLSAHRLRPDLYPEGDPNPWDQA